TPPATAGAGGDPATGASAPIDPSTPGAYVAPPMRVQPPPVRSIAPIHLALVVVALLAGAALFLSGYSLGARTATTPGTPAGEDAMFAPFWDTYRAITERYAGGDIDRKALVEGAIKGMFDALGDPYSSYLTPDEYRKSLQGISGQFEGIGAEIGTQKPDGTSGSCSTLAADCLLVIVSPIEGSPAEKAGLKPGDVIAKIDGKSVDGQTVDQTVELVRGPKGTKVTLTIVRDKGQPFDLTITRDVIVQKEVITKDLDGGTVGYVRVTGFSDGSATAATKAIADFVAGGHKKLILDLRGDPGGFVTAARMIASQFIASGPIFWQEDAQGNQVSTDAEPGGAATDPSIQLIVLIDKGSASASEIVAGAIQDTQRGRLVGETSFGKGTVQQWTPLENDSGGFRLTVAKWLTPAKRWIHHVGLTPDVAVTVPEGTPADQDPILDKALQLLDRTASRTTLDLAA
ncbi:MAG TPA: S41 family peptidase, partial [Candidatus Limnocylindrales bacterium]